MDDRRFDGLARSLGRTRSRRSAIGVLLATAAAVLGGKRAGAQQGWVPIGGACYNTGQCIQDGYYISIFCDDNGFDYDGQDNCCRYEGYCQADEECCGASFCYQGQCTTRTTTATTADQARRAQMTTSAAPPPARSTARTTGIGYTACCAVYGDRCAAMMAAAVTGCFGGTCGYGGPDPSEDCPSARSARTRRNARGAATTPTVPTTAGTFRPAA